MAMTTPTIRCSGPLLRGPVMRIGWAASQQRMANEIISYLEMCRREGVSLQRGMNFGLGGNHSVILMSLRLNAPYEDELQDGGTVLIYEGHDEPRRSGTPDPKKVDQPECTPAGALTQNGLFLRLHKRRRQACGQRFGSRPSAAMERGSWRRMWTCYSFSAASCRDWTRR